MPHAFLEIKYPNTNFLQWFPFTKKMYNLFWNRWKSTFKSITNSSDHWYSLHACHPLFCFIGGRNLIQMVQLPLPLANGLLFFFAPKKYYHFVWQVLMNIYLPSFSRFTQPKTIILCNMQTFPIMFAWG